MPAKKLRANHILPAIGLACVVAHIFIVIIRWLHPATFSLEISLLTLLVGVVLVLIPLLNKASSYE